MRESLASIRDAAQSAGVEIATIAAYTDFAAGRETPEIPQTEMQLAYVCQLAQLANWLGAKIVRVFSGYFTTPNQPRSIGNASSAASAKPPASRRSTTSCSVCRIITTWV